MVELNKKGGTEVKPIITFDKSASKFILSVFKMKVDRGRFNGCLADKTKGI